MSGRRTRIRHAVLTWLPVVLVLAIIGAMGSPGAWELVGACAVGFVASAVFATVRADPRPWLAAAAALLVVSVLAEGLLAPRVWETPGGAGLSEVVGRLDEAEVVRRASRTWFVSANEPPTALRFEARQISGTLGVDWIRSPGQVLELRTEEDVPYVRVTTAVGGDPYLMRTYDAGASIAGETFRARVELRSSEPIEAQGCRGLWLQTWGAGGARACKAVALDPDWSAHELVWTVPETSKARVLRVILNNFDGVEYDVREATLWRRSQDGWTPLPLAEDGATIHVAWTGTDSFSTTTFRPTGDWSLFEASVPARPIGAERLTATIRVGSTQSSWSEVGVRAAAPVPAERARPPVWAQRRLRLWFGHPNLAGHTLLAVLLPLLAWTRGMVARSFLLLVFVGLVAPTGSRSALGALLLGGVWTLTPFYRGEVQHRRRVVKAGLVLFVLIAGLSALVAVRDAMPASLFARTGVHSRGEIWGVAIRSVATYPLRGSQEGFSALWNDRHPRDALPPTHPHNLWLEMAVAAGLLGGAAGLWLAYSLLRVSTSQGLTVVVAALLLVNVVDSTLLHPTVLLPLSFALFGSHCRIDSPVLIPRAQRPISEDVNAEDAPNPARGPDLHVHEGAS